MWSTELWIHQQFLRFLPRNHILRQTTSPHFTATIMVQATTTFSLELSPSHHQNPFSSHQPERSAEDMNQAMTHLWLSAALRVKSKLPTTAHETLHDLAPSHLSCLPLAHHTPGTLAFLLFLESVKFFSTSASLLVLGMIMMGCIYWALTMHYVLSKHFTCMNSFHTCSNTTV